MISIYYPFFTICVFLLLTIITQASLFGHHSDLTMLDRLRLENEFKNGASLLREILENNSQVRPEDIKRLSDNFRAKRCRWKLCGTGRRFRFN